MTKDAEVVVPHDILGAVPCPLGLVPEELTRIITFSTIAHPV